MHRALSAIILASLAVGLAACGSSGYGGMTSPTPPTNPTPSPQTATIAALPTLAFSPSSITIAPGGSVTFAFGSVGHTVHFDSGTNPPANIAGVNANVSIARTFGTAGTYAFHCTIHPGMTGTITVADSSTMSNSAPPPGYGAP